MSIIFSWKRFCDLTLYELYEILKVRQEVFVVEQKCFYLDLDDKDQQSWHLQGFCGDALVCYLRVIVCPDKIKIGRVLTLPNMRKKGVARSTVDYALQKINDQFSKFAIELAAQVHLQKFYESFGFNAISSPYDEDGIMHIDMRKEQ
ncbi:GNAT family N-acetyltransferase [Candidatus Uabimicrobium sp. HlEnr_7]|uniref:GNAT family N-acetyltransferase n=1 Tax=Candidatus Uabimicrobium helgolandensis TaxID=3095367 RepID=UPI003555CBD5